MIWLLCTRYVGRWRRQERLYFSVVFSVTLRGLSCTVIVMPQGRRVCGKQQCDRCLQGTAQQHPSALGCLHGSPLGSGVLGATSCRGPWWGQAGLLQWALSGNGTCLPPAQASVQNHCTGLSAQATHCIFSRTAPVLWQGGQMPANTWPSRARELCPEQSAPHLSQTFCAVAFTAASRPGQPSRPLPCLFLGQIQELGSAQCFYAALPPNLCIRTAL